MAEPSMKPETLAGMLDRIAYHEDMANRLRQLLVILGTSGVAPPAAQTLVVAPHLLPAIGAERPRDN